MSGSTVRTCLITLLAACALAAPAAAHPPRGGLAVTFGQQALPQEGGTPTAQAAQAKNPPLVPAPRADCGPGSRPETGIQGRVPAGSEEGFDCNMTLLGQHGSSGGYKALRFTDRTGRECAYYDTTCCSRATCRRSPSARPAWPCWT